MVVRPTESVIRKTIDSYIQGICHADVEAICALYAEDATVEDPAGTPVRRGIGAIRDFYLYALSAKPELTMMAEPLITGAFSATSMKARVVMEGKPLEIDFISVMSFLEDGRIRMMTAYFDPELIGS